MGAKSESGKSDRAFLTISEVSAELGLPQHILRYWETKFAQLKPLQRAGNRRYYRPEDVALARRINALLNEQGYTVRGVQQLLGQKGAGEAVAVGAQAPPEETAPRLVPVAELKAIRALLLKALEG